MCQSVEAQVELYTRILGSAGTLMESVGEMIYHLEDSPVACPSKAVQILDGYLGPASELTAALMSTFAQFIAENGGEEYTVEGVKNMGANAVFDGMRRAAARDGREEDVEEVIRRVRDERRAGVVPDDPFKEA